MTSDPFKPTHVGTTDGLLVNGESPSSRSAPRLSVVIVAHNSADHLRLSLPALTSQLGSEDQLIVLDNGSTDDLHHVVSALAPEARLIWASENLGFAAGANLAAEAVEGELIVLLNPDAIVQPGWAAAIREPYRAGEWSAWMALVTMGDGSVINTSGGILHFTGLGWAGQTGRPVAQAPRLPTAVGFLSGACLAIPASTWRFLGGFSESYFLYCEDVDLSLRLRLRGERIAVVPDAVAVHAYDFNRSALKWRLLERNRWATIVRTYPGPLLASLVPALLATEVAIWAAALRGGWARMKALATLDFVRWLPRLLTERRQIQQTRAVSASEFASGMVAELSSPYLGGLARHRLTASVLHLYWRAVQRLVR